MTLKAAWMVCAVLGILVVITSVWISVVYLRVSGNRDLKSRLLALSTTVWVVIYGAVIYFAAPSGTDALTPWWIGALSVTGVLFFLSLVLQWGAVRAHGKTPPAFAFMEEAPISFVCWGPYRFVRHPLYSAYLLSLVAGALLADNYWLLISIPWLGYFYYTAAHGEEQSFQGTAFGDEYKAYQGRTGMFLPKPWAMCCCAGGAKPPANESADETETTAEQNESS